MNGYGDECEDLEEADGTAHECRLSARVTGGPALEEALVSGGAKLVRSQRTPGATCMHLLRFFSKDE